MKLREPVTDGFSYLLFQKKIRGGISISNTLKLAFSVAGGMIGAGFATGKELQLFFKNPTGESLGLLVLSIFLMAMVSVLYFSGKQNKEKSSRMESVITVFFLLFSAASYLVMLACGGESLWECFNVPKVLGNTITCIVTLLIVSFGIQGVYRFNLIATPLLIIMMIIVSLVGLALPVSFLPENAEPVLNLLTYTGYNLLSMLPFLDAISSKTPKKEGIRGILLGYFLIAVAGLLLKMLLNVYHTQVAYEALPILKITDIIHPHLTYLYTVMLYLAILTTAVNALYAITRGKYTIPVALILLGFSFFGFTNLLGSLYPLFGYIGIGIVVLILWKILSEKPNRKENKLWQTKKT